MGFVGFQWKRQGEICPYLSVNVVGIWHITECSWGYFPTIIRKLEEPLDIRNQAVHPSLLCSLWGYQRPCRKGAFSACRNVVGEKVTVLLTASQNWSNCTYEEEEMAALNGGRSDVGVCCGTRPVGSVTDLGFTWCFKPGWYAWGRGLRLCLTWVRLWGGEGTPVRITFRLF